LAALLIGGGVALSSHGMKAATRVAVNTSPEPFSNILVSLVEDVVAFGSTVLMAFHPLVILAVVAVFVVIAIWIVPRILRALRRLFQRKRSLHGLQLP
jgi:short subunit fatty acids transporter